MEKPNSIAKILMIVYSPFEWADYCRRPHILAMKPYMDLLIIEPPVGLLFWWLHPKRIIDYLKIGRKPRRNDDGLIFFRPITLGTYGTNFRFPSIAKIDRFLIKLQLNRIIRHLQFPNHHKITYINKIHQFYLMDLIQCDCQIYEVTDEYLVKPGESKIDNTKTLTRKTENTEISILNKANIVFASSPKLYESRRKYNPNTYYIPNTADFNHFNKSTTPAISIPEELAKIAGPRLGYIGNINELIDIELLSEISDRYSNYSLILIGNINGNKKHVNNPQFVGFFNKKNVHHLGFKDYSMLPNYLKGFDISLLPFTNCEWMQSSFPNKIFQYMSSGKPIVSTNYPAIQTVKEFVYIASDKHQFIKLLDEAIKENDPKKIQDRINCARANSTEARAKVKYEIIEDYLSKLIK